MYVNFQKIYKTQNLILYIILPLIIISCTPKPEPINYGQDVCDLCKMNITDNKFAAEIVTAKNRIYKFDSIECLFNFKTNILDENEKIHSEWVNDFSNPGELIDLKKAHFLLSEHFKSPMGLNVLSFSSHEKLIEIKNEYGGEELNYEDVEALSFED